MYEVKLPLPKLWDEEHIAQAFTAYMIGERTFEERVADNPYPYGPFPNDDRTGWTLDMSGDFLLHIRDQEIVLSCYEQHQVPVLEAAATLFAYRRVPTHYGKTYAR
jgi:hypothetical protein